VSAPRFDRVAGAVQRLAVLTAAGIPAASAWRHLAAASADPTVLLIVDGLDSSQDLAERIGAAAAEAPDGERSGWVALAAVWSIATEAGAALSPTLERSAGVLRSLAQSSREVETSLAGPVATSRIVLALPAIGLLMGLVLGFDVLGAFATVPGVICLLGGTGLIVVAVRWNRRLVRRARDLDATPGLGFELLAIALAGGSSVDRALALVQRAGDELGLAPPGEDVQEVLAFATSAGVPVATLLRAEADERRRQARAEAAERAALLESHLLLPLGLCVLPAFVLLGVAPIALAILSSTTVQF
jgi:tight adherence protein B